MEKRRRYVVELRIGDGFAEDIKKLYDEPVKINSNRKVVFVKDASVLSSILTNKRLEVIKCVASWEGMTVNQLAEKLKRNRASVSRDLHFLEDFGLIRLNREKNTVIPIIESKRIEIPISA